MKNQLMSYQELSDEQLMRRIAQREEAAFEHLYDTYAASLMGLALKVIRDRAVAEEVVQETFWRVWTRAETYQEQRGTLVSWLFSITHRLAIDTWRQQKIRPQAVESEEEAEQVEFYADPEANVPEAAWLKMQRAQVQAAMSQLSLEQAQVIRLAYFYGLTRQEISQLLGHPLGTVHTRARLALQKLAKLLQLQGIVEG